MYKITATLLNEIVKELKKVEAENHISAVIAQARREKLAKKIKDNFSL